MNRGFGSPKVKNIAFNTPSAPVGFLYCVVYKLAEGFRLGLRCGCFGAVVCGVSYLEVSEGEKEGCFVGVGIGTVE